MAKHLYNNSDEKHKKLLELISDEDWQDRAWDQLIEFYHNILSKMEDDNITNRSLAKTLGISESAVSKRFRNTPNITLNKMVELSEAVGMRFRIQLETWKSADTILPESIDFSKLIFEERECACTVNKPSISTKCDFGIEPANDWGKIDLQACCG